MKGLITAVWAIFLLAPACSNTGKDQTNNGTEPTDSRISQMIRYNQNGQPFLKVKYEYDDAGLLQREVYWDSSYSGVRTREKVYSYVDTLKKRMELRTETGVNYVGLYSYDEQGRLLREEYVDSSVFKWTEYAYNKHDKITEQTTWEKNGSYRKLIYSYTDAQQIDTILNVDTSGKVLQTDIYTYQNDTMLNTLVMYSPTGEALAKWIYNFNEKNQLVEQVEVAANGNQYVLKKYVYNPQGEVIQEESFKYQFYTRRFDYDSTGTIMLQERYYDKMGNMNYKNIYEPIP